VLSGSSGFSSIDATRAYGGLDQLVDKYHNLDEEEEDLLEKTARGKQTHENLVTMR
jgi:hypothetical protein